MSTLTQAHEALPTGTWVEDPVHSHVGFEVGYATGTFRGSFAPFEARLQVSEDGDAVLSGEARADGVHVLAVTGELTIKGVTAPVELVGTIGDPFSHLSGTERIPLRLEGTVDRRAFGIDWNMDLPSGEPVLANDVTLTAELFLVKE